MAKIYGTYRHKYTNRGNRYTPSFFLNEQFSDYVEAGLTKIIDDVIPEVRFTAEIAPGIKKKTRFVIGEYNDKFINKDDFISNIGSVGSEFDIEMFPDALTAIQWLKDNTDLVEVETGKFEIAEATSDFVTGEDLPALYLLID